jgi:hypothetical protein
MYATTERKHVKEWPSACESEKKRKDGTLHPYTPTDSYQIRLIVDREIHYPTWLFSRARNQ